MNDFEEDLWHILMPLRSHAYFLQEASKRQPDNAKLDEQAYVVKLILRDCEREAEKLGYKTRRSA